MQFYNAAKTMIDAGGGKIIPVDARNSDYAAILAAGTMIGPYVLVLDLFAYAADKRFRVETGGKNVGGLIVPTDRETQAKITGAYVKAKSDATFSIQNWKSGPSTFVALSNAQIVGIGDAVTSHIQAAYSTEASVSAAITGGTITTAAQIDAAAWPSNT